MDTMFLKLGGSLITDKTQIETIRMDVLPRLAAEIGSGAAGKSGNAAGFGAWQRLVWARGGGQAGHAPRRGRRRRLACLCGGE